MQDIISKFVEKAFDVEDMKKTISCVQALRAVCAKQDPQTFNSWILKLKNDLPQTKKSYLRLLVEGKLKLFVALVKISVTAEELSWKRSY